MDVLTKAYTLHDNVLTVEYRPSAGCNRLETEINLAMPSCDGVLGRYVVDGDIPGGFGNDLQWDGIRSLVLEDGVLGGRIEIRTDRPVGIRATPHKTVSQSEDGFEKIMQAATLRILHPEPAAPLAISLVVD
jgi:4-alpha-glucanotransferase/alpha-amylase